MQRRGCGPLETYIFTLRLKMWPVFQKLMAENIDALKKLAEGANAGYFRRAGTTTDAVVLNVSTLCLAWLLARAAILTMCLAGVPPLCHSIQCFRRAYRSAGRDDDLLEVSVLFFSRTVVIVVYRTDATL